MRNLFFELSSKELQGKSGIYKVVCNSHTYIGSSKNLYYRLREHRSDLLSECHYNDFISKTYRKYGASSFHYEIVEFCTPDKLFKRESYYIETLKPDLNLAACPLNRIKVHEYVREKIGKAAKKAWKEGKMKPIPKRRVEMYSWEGEYIKTFESCEDAGLEIGFSTHYVQCAARGYGSKDGRTCGMYRFRYENSSSPVRKFTRVRKEVITKQFEYFYKKDGELISIGGKIKQLNDFLVNRILDDDFEITILIKPKVRVKSGELLESPEEDNQQPSMGNA